MSFGKWLQGRHVLIFATRANRSDMCIGSDKHPHTHNGEQLCSSADCRAWLSRPFSRMAWQESRDSNPSWTPLQGSEAVFEHPDPLCGCTPKQQGSDPLFEGLSTPIGRSNSVCHLDAIPLLEVIVITTVLFAGFTLFQSPT